MLWELMEETGADNQEGRSQIIGLLKQQADQEALNAMAVDEPLLRVFADWAQVCVCLFFCFGCMRT